jgi:glycosyltransferase involved in cell wall biosynthesis
MRSLLITPTARLEQSRHKLFNNVSSLLNQQDIELVILAFREPQNQPILSDSGINVPVKGIAIKLHKRNSLLYMWKCIAKYNPDHILIGGYGLIENWVALIYASHNKLPITFWTGAGEATTRNKSFLYSFLKRLFIKRIDRAITYGTNAQKYLVKLGMNPSQIHNAVNISDVGFFKQVLGNHLNSLEMQNNLADLPRPILVFVGRFEHRKGIELLIERLACLQNHQYFCYFIGTGSLSNKVKEYIDKRKISGKFFGYLPQEEVAKRLVESDVYILPSLNDPFTRTLSEALASGCFVLNSKNDDASFNLIDQGKNGFIFDPENSKQFDEYLQMVVNPEWKRPRREEISQNLKYNVLDYAENIADAVVQTIKK